nr:MAG TPA: hypothetical protein [Caudoviricetes sp.]
MSFLISRKNEVNNMEDKKEKRIRLLSKEVDRLTSENEVLKKENAELQGKVNEMSTWGNITNALTFKEYEKKMKDQIEKAKKLCSLYDTLISKQKTFYAKEKGKYQKATNKAIKEFNKSLS